MVSRAYGSRAQVKILTLPWNLLDDLGPFTHLQLNTPSQDWCEENRRSNTHAAHRRRVEKKNSSIKKPVSAIEKFCHELLSYPYAFLLLFKRLVLHRSNKSSVAPKRLTFILTWAFVSHNFWQSSLSFIYLAHFYPASSPWFSSPFSPQAGK